MDRQLLLTTGMAILGMMFNVYAVNVITGYKNRPDYYISKCGYEKKCSSEERDIDNNNRASVDKVRNDFYSKRNNYLLLIGIVMLVSSFFIKIPCVRNAFAIAGILTILYVTMLNWYKYDDKFRLIVVSLGMASLIYIAYKIYNKNNILPAF